jgi:hypothetical protein
MKEEEKLRGNGGEKGGGEWGGWGGGEKQHLGGGRCVGALSAWDEVGDSDAEATPRAN